MQKHKIKIETREYTYIYMLKFKVLQVTSCFIELIKYKESSLIYRKEIMNEFFYLSNMGLEGEVLYKLIFKAFLYLSNVEQPTYVL